MTIKIKQFLVTLLVWVLASFAFAYELTSTVDVWSKDNTVNIHYTLENTYDYLIFNTSTEAADFAITLAETCNTLNHLNGEFKFNKNKDKVAYLYSSVLIERIQYIIVNASPIVNYPEAPVGQKENYYNKQYYRKSTATGESDVLRVNNRIKKLLYTIVIDGIFTDELLEEYGLPLPENSGLRYELGYGLKGKPLKARY